MSKLFFSQIKILITSLRGFLESNIPGDGDLVHLYLINFEKLVSLVHISNFVTNQLVASARTCCILYNVTLVLDFKIKKTKGGTFMYRMIHF